MGYHKDEIPAFVALDIDFFSDDKKIRRLRRKFGADGIVVYLYLAMEAYRQNGYYCYLDDDLYEDIEELFRINTNRTRQIIGYCCKASLLVRTRLAEVEILTSEGIQKRWMKSVKDRMRKRVARGDGKFILHDGIWITKNLYPEYFYLSHPFSDLSEPNDELSRTKSNLTETNSQMSMLDKSRVDKSRIDSSCREELMSLYGSDAVAYYEARVNNYYNTSKADLNKVQQFLLQDKQKGSGFFDTKTSTAGSNKHNFKERTYDYDALEMMYIDKVNGI